MKFGRAMPVALVSLVPVVPAVALTLLLGEDESPLSGLAFAALVVVGVSAAIWVSARSGELAEIVATDDGVTVRPRGLNRAWALRRSVVAPWSTVRGIRVTDARELPIGMRLPGTSLPGVLTAGSYGRGDDRAFWLVRRGREALVLDLEGHEYRRVVVEIGDAAAMADRLRRAQPR